MRAMGLTATKLTFSISEKMLASAEQSVIDFLATVLEIGGGALYLPPVFADGLEGLPDSDGASEEDGDQV